MGVRSTVHFLPKLLDSSVGGCVWHAVHIQCGNKLVCHRAVSYFDSLVLCYLSFEQLRRCLIRCLLRFLCVVVESLITMTTCKAVIYVTEILPILKAVHTDMLRMQKLAIH